MPRSLTTDALESVRAVDDGRWEREPLRDRSVEQLLALLQVDPSRRVRLCAALALHEQGEGDFALRDLLEKMPLAEGDPLDGSSAEED